MVKSKIRWSNLRISPLYNPTRNDRPNCFRDPTNNNPQLLGPTIMVTYVSPVCSNPLNPVTGQNRIPLNMVARIPFNTEVSYSNESVSCKSEWTILPLSLFQILFPLQYKSCCIRRHARLFSKTCLYYKTCHTNYSKTRLKYRTQQPSVDVTMTSSLLSSNKKRFKTRVQ